MILINKRRTTTSLARRPTYLARLARSADEVRAAQRLRFEVFNLELNEGLAESHFTGLDIDPFDAVCQHLVVENVPTGEIVGTYRLQTGESAAANIGYYSEREFDFAPYEPLRGEMIELGRACVHADHRNFNLLHLLWRGIAIYAIERKARFLVGCSSLTSQDPREGAAMYQQLRSKFLVKPAWRTEPRQGFADVAGIDDPGLERGDPTGRPGSSRMRGTTTTCGASSKLLRAYLAIG